MTTIEIDPVLRKAFRLLHSKSKDSAEKLKALLDEAKRQKHGKSKDPFSIRKESPIPRSKQASPSTIQSTRSSDLKRDLKPREMDDLSVPKRSKLDAGFLKSHTPSPTPSFKSESSRSQKSDDSDSDDLLNENNMLAGVADKIGINCTVCKSFEQTSGNQLVECQECHLLFHQECHKPSVSHQDVNDPRLVWYCTKCSKNMKKQSQAIISSGGGSTTRSASSSVTSSSKNSSVASRSSPSKSTIQKTFANLSTVAARSLGSNSSNSSSSSTRSSSSLASNNRNASNGPPGANSLMNAERRVHLMKKKAAAKNAERRKI